MGDPRKKSSTFEDEALDALNSAGDQTLEAEASQALGAAPERSPDAIGHGESMPTQNIEGDSSPLAELLRIRDQDTAANGGVNPIERAAQAAVGAGGDFVTKGLGPMGRYAGDVIAGGAQSGLQHYRDDPDHSVLDALVAGGEGALGTAGLGLAGRGVSGTGGIVGAGADRARAAAFGAGKDELQALGVTPRELARRTDELGLNNRFIPMDRADKRTAIQGVLSDRGQLQRDAIANADRAGVGANRDWGSEIASDVDANADRVRAGGSGQRGPIMSQMRNVADAAEAHPMESLADLREYKTGRGSEAFKPLGGLQESAAGKAALSGYDSASQHLDQQMSMSGDANYRQFTSADNDFHDAKLLEELTKQPQASNPLRRAVGASIGAGVGAAMGGPAGGIAGAAISDMTRGYQADAAANIMSPLAGGMQGAGNAMSAAAPGGAASATEQLQRAQNESRGDLQADAVRQVLKQNPNALGKYGQQLSAAEQEGTLGALLYKLSMSNDPEWKQQVLPQLQGMTKGP